ncbi:MAG: UDP-3-O-acyl-N-acetylglucosamine deacetylase [Micavibrio sp.]|nr:UDP-3-O-acyl-N-acetylglucosamine deacetylase [Micavibrio sp.]
MLASVSQHTVKHPFTVTGVGVHSGAPATLTVKPAAPFAGIMFVRTDIKDRANVIAARWNNVTDTKLCTVLTNADGVSVSTVEHILSAFAALGLDNAIVEIDGPEIPIMDGSAEAFVAALDKTGLLRQNEHRRVLRIKKTVTYTEGDKEVTLSPSESQFFGFEIAFDNPVIGRQKYTHQLKEATYRADIAAARTFGFLHEVEALRKMGLARGGSLDNAIVVDGDRVLNDGGLRFKNEFVRHKILDAIGDIYLIGLQMVGHYHGVKAGHAMNNKILHVLFSQPDAYEIVELGSEAPRRVTVPVGKFYGEAEAGAVAVTA